LPKVSPETALAALDREIARQSLTDYALRVAHESYEQPAQVLALLNLLQDVEERLERGESPRVIVEMPPRSSKSTHVSRLYPSWHMGRHPTHGVILASYADTLATDNGRAVRDFLDHQRFPFPVKIRADVKAAGRWQTEDGGGLIAVGVGTSLTGWPFPGNLAIVDDPMKGRVEAESEIVRENTWTWWQTTLLTRMAKSSAIVLTGTRWHEDDLIGRVLNSPGATDWTRLRIPYLAESDDPLGRAEGAPLETFGSPPSVEKGEISAYDFSALYQQRPTPAGGGVFKKEWFTRRYCVGHEGKDCPHGAKPLEKGPRWRVIQTADLGGKQGVGHDPSALATWGTDGISRAILDYWSSQEEFVDVRQTFIEKFFEFDPRVMYIEDATWAQPLISSLRRGTGVRVAPRKVEGSKWTRADDASRFFEGGTVLIPCGATWLDGWLHQHLAFPQAQHDEAVDTTSMAMTALGGGMATIPYLSEHRTAQPSRLSIVPRTAYTGSTAPQVM